MMHHDDLQRLLDRRLFLAVGLGSCCGCAMPLFRGQTPEIEAAVEKKLEMIGDYARPWGLNWIKLEAVALVTNLENTGSDPSDSPQRRLLIAEMQSHEVRQADQILASPKTAMVILRGYLPPGVQKGDTFDVEVLNPRSSETTSLRGGWLMQSRMRQMEVLDGSVHRGNIDGLAQGDVLVDAVFDGGEDMVRERRGRVLGGGRSLIARELGLAISQENASLRTSMAISKAVNARFNTIEAGTKRGVANPTRDNYLELAVTPRYKHNLGRYLRVIRNIALKEGPVERVERLQLLEKKLLEPASCAQAALQLEAIGNEAIPALKSGLKSADVEVRFYAAEALAYLDQPESAAPLTEAARNVAAFRWHALTALSTLTHVAALDGLSELLHVASVETRYGAFRALRTRNPGDPTTAGEWLNNKFRYHVIVSTGEPLIHFTRTRVPEIVVFGHEQRLRPPKFLFAGKRIMITSLDNGDLRAARFDPGEETVYETFAPEVDKLIRAVVRLGAGYGEVIQCLQEARQQGCLDARLAVEAAPKPNRQYYRDEASISEPPEGDAADPEAGDADASTAFPRQAATPSPGLFSDQLDSPAGSRRPESHKAGLDGTYIDPAYAPQKTGVLDKLNPFGKRNDQ